MNIICKTGEKVKSLKLYYSSMHWSNIIELYLKSELNNLCYKCRDNKIPYHFHHRTKKRIGNEKLTDIMPICQTCFLADFKPCRSKKKTERRQLAPLGFNSNNISDTHKIWLISIKPHLRGYILSNYYAQKSRQYKPSKQWINAQVKKSCKWINKRTKEIKPV